MRHFLTRLASAATLGLALAGTGSAAFASNAGNAYGERQLAVDLDARCGLFTEGQRAALDAARLQARGMALRDGYSASTLDNYARQIAAQADATDCTMPEVADMRARVADAFNAWQVIRDMNFPGQDFTWAATRSYIEGRLGWALLQDTGEIRVGMARIDDTRRLTAVLPATRGAASAVLVLRDTRRSPELYDVTMGGMFPAPEGASWVHWTPPDYARTLIWAAGRGSAADAQALGSTGSELVFEFTDRAADELAARDPREAARIELIDRQGNVVATHYFEVGDFAAGRAFIHAGDPAAPRS